MSNDEQNPPEPPEDNPPEPEKKEGPPPESAISILDGNKNPKLWIVAAYINAGNIENILNAIEGFPQYRYRLERMDSNRDETYNLIFRKV